MQRPRPLYLGLLGVVLVLVVVYAVWPAASQPPVPSNQPRERTQAGRGAGEGAGPQQGPLDVRLEALKQPPTPPEDPARNPFRFYVKPPPPPPPRVAAPPPQPVNTGPPPPPPVPAIPLKFIGTLERSGQKIAILSDSAGHVSYGPEGATIDGRYRIIRIGAESIEMAYVDGRGRQTIRFTGG